jgi:serine protease Do
MFIYIRFIKRMMRWTFYVILSLLLLVSLVIVTEHYIFPKLSHNSFLSKYSLFQMVSENVTIINNTNEVKLFEDDVLQKLARDNQNSIVTIISNKDDKEGSVGSGAFVTADGVVATHISSVLVGDEDVLYTVLDSSGAMHEAQLLDVDTFTDLAFLKIDGTNYSAVRFANSDDFGPGRKILYIGTSPASGQERIASGIITEKAYDFNITSQSIASTEKLEGVLLAQINTSHDLVGSPVMSMQGEVVGIAGKKIFDNTEAVFVIPSNRVQETLNRITKNGSFERPTLGAYYISLNKTVALQYGLEREEGAWIYIPSERQSLAVLSGSPASVAGLKIKDIVISVNDQDVTLEHPLSNLVQEYSVDETITLKVLRGEKEIDIEVQL